jgi:hypothetical protein
LPHGGKPRTHHLKQLKLPTTLREQEEVAEAAQRIAKAAEIP